MHTYKRNNWTTEEVIAFLEGQKITRADGVECDYCKTHNDVVDDLKDYFYDFKRPLTEFGCLGLCIEDGVTYHIGGIPEEHVEEWAKAHIV